MNKYDRCPRCGHKPHGFTVAYMNIYKCDSCGEKFCHECSGSNNGRKCPKCGSEKKSKIGEAYIE